MGVRSRLAIRREKALHRATRSPQSQDDPARSRGPGITYGLPALTARWTGQPLSGPAPAGLLQTLQRTVGNNATLDLLQRRAAIGAGPGTVVQRGKKTKKTKTKKKPLYANLKSKVNRTLRLPGLSFAAYRAFEALLDRFDEESSLAELKSAQAKYFGLLAAHHLALNMAVAPHPAGSHIADHAGNLVPPYAGAARASFYPSGYTAAANAAWNNWCLANTDPTSNLVQCPGYGRAPHGVAQSAITIDHIVSVCTHWNTGHGAYPAGRNSTRAQRIAFFNDTTNHTYLCGPCNTSKGSGGTFYQQNVGINFRN